MENEILIALIAKLVAQRVAELPLPVAGTRGPRGPTGNNGKDFAFEEHEGTIRAWAKEFALKFKDLSDDEIQSLRGPRGADGRNGRDGNDFVFEQNRDSIESILKSVVGNIRSDLKLKFNDLTAEEIGQLRGPRGRDGQNGSFIFDDNREKIEEAIKSAVGSIHDELKLRFTDLTAEEIGQLRGPRGRDGDDGSFIFEENRKEIESCIRSAVDDVREQLKLQFSDLTEEEISQIRGARGRDGRDGKNFIFEEHLEFFQSLKLKFSDLTEDELCSLKLKFSELTEEERASLKLKFEDLSDDDKLAIRGPRGLRGQRGSHGRDGKDGRVGARGLPGPQGFKGLNGRDGLNGADGEDGGDAPYITEIEVDTWKKNEVYFTFHFSDGSEIVTNKIDLPAPVYVTMLGGGGIGTSGGGGGGASTLEFFDQDGTSLGIPTEVEFTGDGVSSVKIGDRVIVDIPGGGGGGDSEEEHNADIDNNQASPTDISGFVLDDGVSFQIHICFERTTDAEEIFATEIWLATKLNVGYRLTPVVQDVLSGITLSVEDDGQVQYISTNMSGTPITQKASWKFERLRSTEIATGIILNNQASPIDVDGMLASADKSQLVHYYIERALDSMDTDDVRQTGIAMVTKTSSDRRLTIMFDDGIAGVTLSITSTGQFQYVSTDVGGDFDVKKISWKFFDKLVG